MNHRNWTCAVLFQALLAVSAHTIAEQADTGAALLFSAPSAEQTSLQQLTLGAQTSPALADLLASPASIAIWQVDIQAASIDADHAALAVKLPDQGEVRFDLKRSSDVAGMSGWIGDVESGRKQRFSSPDEMGFDPFNWISLVRDGDQVVGDIYFNGQHYRLLPTGAGRHVLVKVDDAKMAPGGEPILPSQPSAAVQAEESVESDHSTIRVLFVTTNERRARSPHYRAELVQALQNANQYMINSRVPITYELAGFFDPDYGQGTKSQWVMLQEMANTGGALGRPLAIERDRLGAALVSLYNTETSICENAYGWSKKAYRKVVERFYPKVMEYTLYEHEQFKGRSCVVTHVGASSSFLHEQCGSGWNGLVSSVRIRGIAPGTYVLLASAGNRGTRSFSSTTYRGNLDVPFLDTIGDMPAGLTSSRTGQTLNNRLERVASFE